MKFDKQKKDYYSERVIVYKNTLLFEVTVRFLLVIRRATYL